MKIILIGIHENDGAKVTHEFEAGELDTMLRNYRYFLQGLSFVIDAKEELLIDDSALYEVPVEKPYSSKKRKKSKK